MISRVEQKITKPDVAGSSSTVSLEDLRKQMEEIKTLISLAEKYGVAR
jgi:hypothetical protein